MVNFYADDQIKFNIMKGDIEVIYYDIELATSIRFAYISNNPIDI